MARLILKLEFEKLSPSLRQAIRAEAMRWLTAQPLPDGEAPDDFGERAIDMLRERMYDRAGDYARRVLLAQRPKFTQRQLNAAAMLWRYFAYRLTGASPFTAFMHV